MSGHILGLYTIYTFSGALAPWQNFARCKIDFTSKSCILLYWHCYCTTHQTLQHGTGNGITILKLCRGCHLYSAGQPSRWASAHILVVFMLPVPVQLIARKDCPWNDLVCVEMDLKQLLTHSPCQSRYYSGILPKKVQQIYRIALSKWTRIICALYLLILQLSYCCLHHQWRY